MGAGLLLPAKRKPPSYLTTTRLTSHSACITCISLSGDRAFTASKDRSINMWNLSQAQATRAASRKGGTGTDAGAELALDKPLKVFEGHSHWVTELLLEKSGCLLYSGGMDKTMRVWDVTTGVCLYVYCGHTDWLSGIGLVFTSPPAALAAASAPSPFLLKPASSVTSTSDTPSPDFIVTCSHDSSLRLWQPYRPSLRSRADEACLAAFVLPGGGSITSAAVCAFGVVCASNFGAVAFLPTHDPSNMAVHSTRAHIGPVTALSAVHRLPRSCIPPGRVTNFNSGCAASSHSAPDPAAPTAAGDALVCFSGGADGCVCMWTLQPLRCVHKYEAGAGTGVSCLAFHPRPRLLTVTYEKGETLSWMDQARVPLDIQLVGGVRCVAHAAHGGVVAATTSGVTVYHPTKGQKLAQLSDQRCSCLLYIEERGVAGGRLAFAEGASVVVCCGDVLQEAQHDIAVKIGR